MARNEEEENLGGTSTTPSTTTRLRVRPDPFLLVCRGFSVVTSLTAILCIGVNVISAIRSFQDGSDVLLLPLLAVFVCICAQNLIQLKY